MADLTLGVLSDTHIPHAAKQLPGDMIRAFAGVDAILHAGDITDYDVITRLESLAEVVAVYGNMDPPETRERLDDRRVVEFGGVRIGLTHGHGAPAGIERRVCAQFEDVDVVVVSHSHRPVKERDGDVLLLNPGSPTDRHFAAVRSYGVLEISGPDVHGRIVRLPD